MTFDPSCAFLLDRPYENLFEAADASPGNDGGEFRCKGCGRLVGRTERKAHHGHHRGHRGAYRRARDEQVQHEAGLLDAALDTGDDRASADAGTDRTASSASANGRPDPPATVGKGEQMPQQQTRRRNRKTKTAGAAPARARSASTAEKPPAAEKGEKGTSILDALYKNLEGEIGAFEKKPNKSGTSTRLLIDGKSFAVVFPPRPNSVAVKIPKQLMEAEKGLPSGHGFKTTGWGLTRTLSAASETSKAAKALAVAAKLAKPDDDDGASE